MAKQVWIAFLEKYDPLTTSMTASVFEPNTFCLAPNNLASDKQLGITVTATVTEFQKFQILTPDFSMIYTLTNIFHVSKFPSN